MIIDLVVMQAIDLCNLNCSYCYLPGRKNPVLMSEEVLHASFKSIFNSSMVTPIHENDEFTILWHSGEPLTAGIDFYKRTLKILQQYNTKKMNVAMEIQTNATLINQEWCDFFKKNNFIISVSIDGPAAIHDHYRKNWSGKGSHKLAMRGVNYLKKNNMPVNAICVLTKDSLNYPKEIYKFFKENGFNGVCFNVEEQECFNKQSTMVSREDNPAISVTQRYQNFMSTIYDLWERDGKTLWIREFNTLIQTIKLRKRLNSAYLPRAEALAFNIISITKDGEISTFSPELSGGITGDRKKFHIGNVLHINSLDELVDNNNFQNQLASIKSGIEKCSSECDYFGICGGGSPSNKYYENGSFDTTETSFCILTKKILTDLVLKKLTSNQL